MEKSIESIWKEGFVSTEDLSAPKLNNLYGQKSQQIVEQLGRTYKKNLKSIVVAAIGLLLFSVLANILWAGAGIAALLFWLVWISKKMAAEESQLDQSLDSYHYLKAYDAWIEDCFERYIKIYRFLYPMLIGLFGSGFLYIQFPWMEQAIVQKAIENSDPLLFMGLPVVWLGVIWGYALLFGIFARPVYKLDIKLVYGRTFNKLKGIIADMEQLR